MNYSLDDLKSLIIQWANERNLLNSDDIIRQYLKLVEETGELAAGLARKDEDKTKDALGDIFVVWTILVAKFGYDHNDIVKEVYHIINERKGKTVNGVFIKEEDIKE